MRSLVLTLIFGLGLISPDLFPEGRAEGQTTLMWNAAPNDNLAGYYLAWGTNSGVYFATNTYPPTQTTGSISNLTPGVVYYAAVAAFSSNGLVSPFSNEAMFTNSSGSGLSGAAPVSTQLITNQSLAGGGAPPAPPTPGKPGGGKPAPPGGGTGTSAGGSSSGSSAGAVGASSSSSTNITQAQIWGIPPVLNLAVSNSVPTLTIGGTVGATVAVQTTVNPGLKYSWTTVTNILLTNAAPIANPNPGQPQDAIDLAYVPAAQPTDLPVTAAPAQFFRVVMPYDYIILAGMVLPPKGYSARLVVVNMPGLNDDCCYVSQAGSFIHYSPTNSALQLAGSGSTIRQIASTLAGNMKMDWTSASEFVYSNGMGQIMATVVQTDPPSSDPVAGQTPTSAININF